MNKIFEIKKIHKGNSYTKKTCVFGICIVDKYKTLFEKRVKILNLNVFHKRKAAKGYFECLVFGIPVFTHFKNFYKECFSVLGVPVLKIKNNTQCYLFGIHIFNKEEKLNNIDFDVKQIPDHFLFEKVESPEVSIIIPVYNQCNYTMNCLYSILRSGDSTKYEIIIADDCSTDETKELSSKAKNITIVRNTENLGYIKNVNNAAKYAKGDYLYFLNNDTVVTKNWLEKLVNVIKSKKDAGVVGSKILKTNNVIQECGVLVFKDVNMCENTRDTYLKKTDYVSCCSFLTPKKLFDEIGGFDERYSPAYYDDPDYCLSALEKGFNTYVQPSSVVYHYGSLSYNDDTNNLIKNNGVLFREKWKRIYEQKTEYSPLKEFSYVKRPASILLIDSMFPRFDRHAGGKTILNFLQVFVKLGLNVKFCPYYYNKPESPYYEILADMGIETIFPEDIDEWLNDNIASLDYLFLSRPEVAENFDIEKFKSQGVKVLYYGHDLHFYRMMREKAYTCEYDESAVAQTKELEKKIISTANKSYYPSIVEKDYISKEFDFNNVNVILPYLYNADDMPVHNSYENSEDLIFVGSHHSPNLDALKWFVKDIFPTIVKAIPNIKLNIVGSILNDYACSLKSQNINLLGTLSDEELDNLYKKTKLSVVPLRYGAGIKGKVIDAVYHKVPVVTTKIGAEGINCINSPILVTEDKDDFAQSVIELYTNKTKWTSYDDLYFKFINENCSYDKAAEIFMKEIDCSYRCND